MTFEMTLGLIVFGFSIVIVGIFLLSIYFSAKKSEKDSKENLEHVAKVNEMLKEKAQRRVTDWEKYSYLNDLWDC